MSNQASQAAMQSPSKTERATPMDTFQGAHQGPTKSTTETIETLAPGVVQGRVQPVVREELTEQREREHHVHHYQQRVQPVADQVVEPEKHTEHVASVKELEQKHELSDKSKRVMAEQQAAYHNTQETLPTRYEKVQAAAVQQDATHHHVHETVQPVIQREVVAPEVVHTTVPVHEVVHDQVLHEATVEPTITLEQFKQQGVTEQGDKTVKHETKPGSPQTLPGAHVSGEHQHTAAIGTSGHLQTGRKPEQEGAKRH